MSAMAVHLKRFPVMFVLSWLMGAAVVVVWLRLTSPADFSLADMTPLWLIVGVGGLLLSALYSLPLLLILRRRLGAAGRTLFYPLANAALVTLPVAAISYSLAFFVGNLPAAEAGLFTTAFFALSLMFGLMFAALYRTRDRQH